MWAKISFECCAKDFVVQCGIYLQSKHFVKDPKTGSSKKNYFQTKWLKTGTVKKYLTYINYTPSFFPSSSISQIPSIKSIAFPLKLKTKFVEFIKNNVQEGAHISNLLGLSERNIIKNLSDTPKNNKTHY